MPVHVSAVMHVFSYFCDHSCISVPFLHVCVFVGLREGRQDELTPPPPNDHSSVEVRRKWHITALLVRAIEFITGDHNYSSVPF